MVAGRDDDHPVVAADFTPAAAEAAGAVTQRPPGRLGEDVMPAARNIRPCRLERRRTEVRAQYVGQLVGGVRVEHDGAGSAAVQRNVVIGSGEPRSDLLGMAAGLRVPLVADDRAGIFRAAPDRQDIPAGGGVGQGSGQRVDVRIEVGDYQL